MKISRNRDNAIRTMLLPLIKHNHSEIQREKCKAKVAENRRRKGISHFRNYGMLWVNRVLDHKAKI